MSKLVGDEKTIKWAKDAPAGDKSVYINWDAIKDLPDEFEVVVTSVKYDPKNLDASFSDIGSGMRMPTPDLMYRIAEACGISGGSESETAPIIEEIDINPMLCKPIDTAPNYQRKIVGRSVSKRSSRMMEDGSMVFSSLCTAEYNVWERCNELWSKEEMYTDGYAKKGKYDNKYDNPYKRRNNFDSEMKFAHAKAESKAYLKTIRELAGLPTGFKSGDLTSGQLLFSKVRRSPLALKAETAARLGAISRGVGQSTAQAQLFGPVSESEIYPEPIVDIEQEPTAEDISSKEDNVILLAVLEEYLPNIKDEGMKATAKATIEWLEKQDDPKSNKSFYNKALKNLKIIEDEIPEAFRITHMLYE